MYKYFKMSTTSLVVRHACNYSWPSLNPTKNILILTIVGPHPHSFLFFSLSSMPFSSLFIASIVPSFVSSSADALSLSFRCCLLLWFVFLLVCLLFLFLILFLSSQTTHLLLSCFCFSHPKHQNPIELNQNRMQSVGPVFFPYKLVSVLNMLKPKFSARCKNYLQHRPT